jgi:conjugal transfer pilus assembly protein TraV
MKGKFLLWAALMLVLAAGCATPYVPQGANDADQNVVQDQPGQYTEEYASPSAAALPPPGPSTTAVQGLGYTGPLPLRSAAQLMRVWLAPWESMDGALHLPTYLYAEVEERKWSIGGRKMNVAPQITPLEDRDIPQAPDKAQKKPAPRQPVKSPPLQPGPQKSKNAPNNSFFERKTGTPQATNMFNQLGQQSD